MHGDAICIPADFDFEGYPRQLVPVDPRAVEVYVDNGEVLYDIHTDIGVITLTRSQVWHARGLTLTSDGLRGVGVVRQFMLAIGLDVALQRYGINAFNSGVPTGIIKVKLRNVSQTQSDELKADWMYSFQDRSPAVLSELMDFTPISWSPIDAQYLEQRKMSVAEIAFVLNLDPTDLDTTLGSSLTYSNREQRSYDRLLTSVGPYLTRIEQAFKFLVPRGHKPTFDRSIVLWADSKTRAEVQQIQLANGSITLNEVRAAEQKPLYEDWADEPFGKPPADLPIEPPPPRPTLDVLVANQPEPPAAPVIEVNPS